MAGTRTLDGTFFGTVLIKLAKGPAEEVLGEEYCSMKSVITCFTCPEPQNVGMDNRRPRRTEYAYSIAALS